MFANIIRPLTSSVASFLKAGSSPSALSNQVRFASKTHRSAYRRWRKTADGYKHGKQGRKHGNTGFTNSLLKKRTGIAYSTSEQSNRLKKLMPYL